MSPNRAAGIMGTLTPCNNRDESCCSSAQRARSPCKETAIAYNSLFDDCHKVAAVFKSYAVIFAPCEVYVTNPSRRRIIQELITIHERGDWERFMSPDICLH